jgi:uncharacterized LabA/DUF88 family protein
VGRTGRIPRVGLFVDAQNTGGWGLRPDLQRLREEAARLGSKPGTLEVAVVATAIRPAENGRCPAVSFLRRAKELGYRVEERWTVLRESTGEIKADIDALLGFVLAEATLRHRLNRVVLVTCDSDFTPVVQRLGRQMETVVVGPRKDLIPWELFIAAHYAYGLTELGLALAPADAA